MADLEHRNRKPLVSDEAGVKIYGQARWDEHKARRARLAEKLGAGRVGMPSIHDAGPLGAVLKLGRRITTNER
ncbi:hypothetical protein E2A64_05565 [Pseudohoeflea suaedae]|uniref:Uncharacterized protein n=1 Tax=Pseudohoeflea suaedae TaxID=877384 RepID=A0A4R5PNL4_9HYPH|nr:hypothetical protein [Pseudohoeflea suaedae]TDH38569.1 hypothetical protein E2A64_05565 [Pseudohoeflea suaedae]